MPKSKYYKLLGLSPGASEKEIRKKYRTLALKLHPDQNDSPVAKEEFIRLTEAHDILLGKIDPPFKKAVKSAVNTEEEKLKRAKEAQIRFNEQLIRNHIENEKYYRKLTSGKRWKSMKASALIGALLALFLTLDLFLPNHYNEQEVIGYRRNFAYAPNGQQISLVKTSGDNYYWISRITFSMYGRSRKVLVESSWFFHNSIRLISKEKIHNKYFDIHFSFYSTTWLLLILFLTPAFTLWYKRKKISFTVLYHFSSIGVNGLMIFYLLTDNRWAHILTLGFY
jgi:hypothetical protein